MTFTFELTGMCNCGALAATANAMGHPPSHGPDCPMCSPTERWLKVRIRELEAAQEATRARAHAEGKLEGKAEGLEEAARLAEMVPTEQRLEVASAIRLLAQEKP